MFSSQIPLTEATVFLLAFMRTGAMFLTLPKLMSDRYFLMYRLLFALVLALVITPLVAIGESSPRFDNPANAVSLLIAELGVGICLGLATSCVVIGLLAAGQIVSQLLGFQIGSLQQGLNGEQASDYRKLLFIVGLCSWFAVSGHRFAVEGLLQSFTYFPLGQYHFSTEVLELTNQLIGASLAFAIRFALPVLLVSIFGFLISGFFSSILGVGQSTSFAFGLNQILFFIIGIPLLVVYADQVTSQTAGQVEQLISFLTDHAPREEVRR